MKKLFLVMLLAVSCGLAVADTVQLKEGHPETYTVKKGDTLWDISSLYLEDPWLWPEIWHINPQVENPHLIYPGDELKLVYIDEQPKVTVAERGPIKISADENVKLAPKVRTRPVESAIPAIPLEKISAFLSKNRVVDVDALDDAPYVLSGEDKRIIAGAGDTIYARGDFNDDHKTMGIYRPGTAYIDPETDEVLGFEAESVGSVRVVKLDKDIATLSVNRSSQEIRINDRLLPSEEKKVVSMFYPKAPDQDVSGLVVSVEGSVNNAASMSVVAVNLGERDGIQVGDILEIYQTGEVVKDSVRNQLVQLPDVRAGLLIVFRPFEKMSLGLILQTDKPVSRGDKVSSP